jgi:MinD-like ATPase involved in chromosome partitioning or flagellar assembly
MIKNCEKCYDILRNNSVYYENLNRKHHKKNMSVVENNLPNCFNKKFFEDVLRSYKKDKTIEILNILTDKEFDEHYGSKMYCLKLEFKSKASEISEELRIVIKTIPDSDDPMSQAFENVPLMDVEIKMYQKVLPLIDDLLNRHGMMKGLVAPE